MADVPTYSPNEDALEFQSTGWQKAYLAAILETNNSNLPERIRDAEDAIVARKQQLGESVLNGAAEELSAIQDALSGLAVLRKERIESSSS
jgi:hypothetical protein